MAPPDKNPAIKCGDPSLPLCDEGKGGGAGQGGVERFFHFLFFCIFFVFLAAGGPKFEC